MLEKLLLAVGLTFALNLSIKISWSSQNQIGNKINSSLLTVVSLTQRGQ